MLNQHSKIQIKGQSVLYSQWKLQKIQFLLKTQKKKEKSVSKATYWEVWHQGRQIDQKYVGKMDGAQRVGLQHNYIQ